MTDEREVATVLAERPDLESALESIRAVDDDAESWTFEDLSIDSGTFGEVVSEGLVEKTDDGYRLPDATRHALDGDIETTDRTATDSSLPSVDIDPRASGALAGALALVVLFRTVFSYGAVFVNDKIILAGNDPYYYRYWVEGLLTQTGGQFHPAVLSKLPVAKGEPLMVATLYSIASLLGGGADAAGTVLAWYPVILALVTAALLYYLAVTLTDDRRIGLAAVVFLATTPAHAMRTSLGFADHHAFDYPWLALIAVVLVVLARRDESAYRDPIAWLAGLGLGAGIAGQILAWENGPALVVPVALYVAVVGLLDVEADRSPLRANAPLLGGIVLAAVLVQYVHGELGWHTDFIAFTPVLLLVGTVCVLSAAAAFRYLELPTVGLAGLEAALGIGSLVAVQTWFPTFWADLLSRVDTFFATKASVETKALVDGNLSWLLLLGLVLFVAIPPLVWASKQAFEGSRQWAVASVYTWYFLVLGAFQIRFVGELAVFSALFAGFGFVWLAHWVDLTDTPLPFETPASARPRLGDGGDDRDSTSTLELPSGRDALLLLALFLLVGGVGIVQTPVKTNQLTIDTQAAHTATWIDDYATQQNLSYPEDYVLSQWGRNRMFNAVVNGQSKSYGYARNNYASLLTSTNGSDWYRQHRKRVGFVVTQPLDTDASSLHSRLDTAYGSATNRTAGLAHFRALYVSPNGEYKVFRLVPGATISGTAPANATTVLSHRVEIPGGSFTYQRAVRTGSKGHYQVTVPYPGQYTLWNDTVTVTERNVTAGQQVR
ncbi:MAG: STT3 domain-containing protein [Halorientalis sp.]